MSNTKLLVPSGTLVHDNCGDTLSPTQLGLFFELAWLLAIFFGIILPSWNVDDFSVKTPAASAVVVARPKASVAAAAATIWCRFRITMFPPVIEYFGVRN